MPRNLPRCTPWPGALVLGGLLAATMSVAAQAPRATVDAQVGAAGMAADPVTPRPTGWWQEWAGLRASIKREHRAGPARTGFDQALPSLAALNGAADRIPHRPAEGLDDVSGTLSYASGPYAGTAAVHGYRVPAADRAFAIEWDLATAFALGARARYGRMTAKYADYRINNDALTRSATPSQFGNTRTFWLQWEWQWQSPSR
ncbi:hypothetical protein [Nevskia sp.]|uniref:hypothetical protein n=1 Tax=Nevskia sp. TaxID=1929292 RepID=UPI0025F8556A|nr:hypothetical protein [Nevskia sp.]